MSLLLRNIQAVVTCDGNDTVYEKADIFCEGGLIREIGSSLGYSADRVIDCTGMLCYPGLVNTHHHFYQIFSRNLPQVQGMQLFDWLTSLYEIWKKLDPETVYLSSQCALALLMKSGCTTAFDHHYVFPGESSIDLLEAQFEAARSIGARMAASRGSMNLSRKDGGLPPDSVVQTTDKILKDSVDAVERFHDASYGSMRTVALAPCSPFSASGDLYRESARLARSLGVRLHTHLCETIDEENYTIDAFGMRPLEYMRSLGFIGDDVWYAHGIWFNDEELDILAATGTAVAHCPASNMKLASGAARIPDMLRRGIPVSLAVDGSASNDGSDLLEEMRIGYLLGRVTYGDDAPTAYDYLKMATVGGAKTLGRTDIGSIEIGKCADMFLIDTGRLDLIGAAYSPKTMPAAVGLCGPVDYTVVNGEVTVEKGRLTKMDEEALFSKANQKLNEYLGMQ
jgi:cytosine/adenosine deaminase-related metal-dependent hydrolase